MLKNFRENFTVKFAHNFMQKAMKKSFHIMENKEEILKIPNKDKVYMLYAHIPFCHTFCPYCSFHKYQYNEELCKKYFENLRKEMKSIKEAGYLFSSLYVGGGTTLIDEVELEKTLILAKELFDITEISCETDPNHIKPEELQRFVGLIDRLSIGVQSFNNDILRKVARLDKFGTCDVLIEKLNKAKGILPMMSLDLIFNFPFQRKEELLFDIKKAQELNFTQTTFYPLMKSELTRHKIANALGVNEVNNEKEFYEIICEEFKDYHRLNAWAFAKNATNLKDEYVSSNREYLGIGSGAFSFLEDKLLVNAFKLDEYENLVKNEKSTVIASAKFDQKSILQYQFLTQMFDGALNISSFNEINSCNILKDLSLELSALKFSKALFVEGNFIKTTAFGRYLFLTLMKDFYTEMDKVRAKFR